VGDGTLGVLQLPSGYNMPVGLEAAFPTFVDVPIRLIQLATYRALEVFLALAYSGL